MQCAARIEQIQQGQCAACVGVLDRIGGGLRLRHDRILEILRARGGGHQGVVRESQIALSLRARLRQRVVAGGRIGACACDLALVGVEQVQGNAHVETEQHVAIARRWRTTRIVFDLQADADVAHGLRLRQIEVAVRLRGAFARGDDIGTLIERRRIGRGHRARRRPVASEFESRVAAAADQVGQRNARRSQIGFGLAHIVVGAGAFHAQPRDVGSRDVAGTQALLGRRLAGRLRVGDFAIDGALLLRELQVVERIAQRQQRLPFLVGKAGLRGVHTTARRRAAQAAFAAAFERLFELQHGVDLLVPGIARAVSMAHVVGRTAETQRRVGALSGGLQVGEGAVDIVSCDPQVRIVGQARLGIAERQHAVAAVGGGCMRCRNRPQQAHQHKPPARSRTAEFRHYQERTSSRSFSAGRQA